MRCRPAMVFRAIALGTLVVLGVPGVAAATSPAIASANPASDLRDGQTIAISGAGFDPDAQVGMVECLIGATGTAQCDLAGIRFTTTDAAGSLSSQFTVTRVINVGGALTDCATPNACVLGLQESANPTVSATVALSFEDVPIVAPAVTVGPSTGLLDAQTVEVEGSGFTPGATVALLECPADSLLVSDCDFSTGLFVQADGGGTISTTYRVVRIITVTGTSLDCAEPLACVLGVGNVDDFAQRSVIALSFANLPMPVPTPPPAPSAPAPSTPPVGALAMTGFAPAPLVGFGGGLVVAGMIALFAGRRRPGVPRPSPYRLDGVAPFRAGRGIGHDRGP
jgi:hypothetical protein